MQISLSSMFFAHVCLCKMSLRDLDSSLWLWVEPQILMLKNFVSHGILLSVSLFFSLSMFFLRQLYEWKIKEQLKHSRKATRHKAWQFTIFQGIAFFTSLFLFNDSSVEYKKLFFMPPLKYVLEFLLTYWFLFGEFVKGNFFYNNKVNLSRRKVC